MEQRLIDADALIPMMKYATTDSEIGIFPIKIGFNAIAEVINNAPTIDAIPVAWIEERISNAKEAGQTLIAQMWQELIDGYNRESK